METVFFPKSSLENVMAPNYTCFPVSQSYVSCLYRNFSEKSSMPAYFKRKHPTETNLV